MDARPVMKVAEAKVSMTPSLKPMSWVTTIKDTQLSK